MRDTRNVTLNMGLLRRTPMKSEIRECVTVAEIGTFLGRRFYVDPFENEDAEDWFISQLRGIFGGASEEDTE